MKKRGPYIVINDRVRYIVYVLYLGGFSLSMIGTRVGLRTKQVAGVVANSEFTNRAAMTLDERNAKLAELKAIRRGEDGRDLDGGILTEEAFTARPLKGRQNV